MDHHDEQHVPAFMSRFATKKTEAGEVRLRTGVFAAVLRDCPRVDPLMTEIRLLREGILTDHEELLVARLIALVFTTRMLALSRRAEARERRRRTEDGRFDRLGKAYEYILDVSSRFHEGLPLEGWMHLIRSAFSEKTCVQGVIDKARSPEQTRRSPIASFSEVLSATRGPGPDEARAFIEQVIRTAGMCSALGLTLRYSLAHPELTKADLALRIQRELRLSRSTYYTRMRAEINHVRHAFGLPGPDED